MDQHLVSQLAPRGVLRVGINLTNFLLVSGASATGEPEGVAPDMGREIAKRLGVPVQYVTYPGPGFLVDAAESDSWDIGLVAIEPARADRITFSSPYAEIEATYMVRADSPLTSIDQVDRPGHRIASTARAAYDLWLERNIRHAEVIRCDTMAIALQTFLDDKLDALAGLRAGLATNAEQLPGLRLLDGKFSSVRQAVGTKPANVEGAAFLRSFVEEAKASGLVAELIKRHNRVGLAVAPAGD